MLSKFNTICLLMYGDYPELHRVAVGGLMRSDLRYSDVRIWCNVVCVESLRMLLTALPSGWWIYINDENRPKYRLMRDMVHDGSCPIETPWVTWLDDDTLLMKPNWAIYTREHLLAHRNIDFCGKETNGRFYPGAYNVVKSASWYTGARFGKGISRHVYGAYWWSKTEIMRELDWPDRRLSHNGGDWLLSEALRQQGYTQADLSYGIKVQLHAKRRGLSEVSVGRRNNKHTSSSDGKAPTMVGRQDIYRELLEQMKIPYEVFDHNTLLVKLPVEVDVKRAQGRLAALATATYPSALPAELFVQGKQRVEDVYAKRLQRIEQRKSVREDAHARKQQARKAREARMRDKMLSPNAPRPTSPLPRVDKTKPDRPLPPLPPKARKTLKRILEERHKR